jgi:hypothetical protein
MTSMEKADHPATTGILTADSKAAETLQSEEAHTDLDPPSREQQLQGRLMPLFEQLDPIVRAVLDVVSDSQLARYRAECKCRSCLGDKTCKYQAQNSRDPRSDTPEIQHR